MKSSPAEFVQKPANHVPANKAAEIQEKPELKSACTRAARLQRIGGKMLTPAIIPYPSGL
jgi:hypothetical protein